MTKAEGNREYTAYLTAKDGYLEAGKRYSAIMGHIMKLDPNILNIAEEIMITGDGLSAYDNKFLTSFYKDLKAKSKIDKQYYDLLLELKKTKSELDIATAKLSKARVSYLLRKSGIPPRRNNQGFDAVAAHVNNPDLGLLEKLSLPNVLDLQSSESLDELMSAGELTLEKGVLVPKTKSARNFIKKLERDTAEKVNDRYFTGDQSNLISKNAQLNPDNMLEFLRSTADNEHIREIERRLAAKDIQLSDGKLLPLNSKGEKYLDLLTEELTNVFDKKLSADLLAQNSGYAQADPRLGRITSKISDLDISMSRHSRLGSLAGPESVYGELIKKANTHKTQVNRAFAELMMLQETISSSFVEIKKQLALVLAKNKVQIDQLISLLLAVRYLAVYEQRYEAKLEEIESLLGVITTSSSHTGGPMALGQMKEQYPINVDEDVDALVRSLIMNRLSSRRELGQQTNETIISFLLNSPQSQEYRTLASTQLSAKKHVMNTLYNNHCLYDGLDDISEILAEITELEVEKTEKLADLAHELELAHKELWLARITNDSKKYIDDNFGAVPAATKQVATKASREAVAQARKEIRDTLAKYRASHKEHSDNFAKVLRASLANVSRGGDVAQASAELKRQYAKMNAGHNALMNDMEKDILKLEKRLSDLEAKAPSELEKLLISDIRSKI
jgi:hypothetical protein